MTKPKRKTKRVEWQVRGKHFMSAWQPTFEAAKTIADLMGQHGKVRIVQRTIIEEVI